MHDGGMGFEFDSAKARGNLRKHGVSVAHAEQAFRDEMAVTIEDPDVIGEKRFVTLGMDTLGRALVVVLTQRGERTCLISARKASRGELEYYLRDQYDLSNGKRGAMIASPGKTRITIMLDDDVIETFRVRAEEKGVGYQTLINSALRQAIANAKPEKPLTVATLRRVLREELRAA